MNEVKSLTPKQAYELSHKNPQAILVDVRSSMEFLFVGHATGSVNIPWIDEPDWVVDPHFTSHIRQLMLGGLVCDEGGCVPVMLICRSGKRSLEAGNKLIEEGFPEVYNVEGGFEGPLDDNHQRSTKAGWRFEGLPWEQC